MDGQKQLLYPLLRMRVQDNDHSMQLTISSYPQQQVAGGDGR